MSAAYEFVTTWRVPGSIGEVKAVLSDAEALARWWPSVYLDVVVIDSGAPDAVGRTVDLHTKGWLPYTLRWRLRITEPVTDAGFALAATGDLEGQGRWTFRQDGPEVVIVYDWRVSATKPSLRRLSWLLRPAFAANHHWAMARGEESLQLELRRRRVSDAQAAQEVPGPPAATFSRLRRLLPFGERARPAPR
ncbi:MAG: SRPBCC family protein [Acidimicrobiales bacterium]